jgi:hypothetical protein
VEDEGAAGEDPRSIVFFNVRLQHVELGQGNSADFALLRRDAAIKRAAWIKVEVRWGEHRRGQWTVRASIAWRRRRSTRIGADLQREEVSHDRFGGATPETRDDLEEA